MRYKTMQPRRLARPYREVLVRYVMSHKTKLDWVKTPTDIPDDAAMIADIFRRSSEEIANDLKEVFDSSL